MASFIQEGKKSFQKTNKNKRNIDLVLWSELLSSRMFATNNIEHQEVTEEIHVGKLECCFVLTERSIMTLIQQYNHKKPDPLIHTTNSDMWQIMNSLSPKSWLQYHRNLISIKINLGYCEACISYNHPESPAISPHYQCNQML